MDLIEKINKSFEKTLPGEAAQLKMAPSIRKPTREYNLKSAQKSSIMILLCKKKGSLQIPFILRKKGRNIHSGQVSFPGGKKEHSDKDLIETAIRETHEEIGVLVARKNVLGTMTDLYIPPSNFLVTPVIAYIKDSPKFNLSISEVEAAFYIDFFLFKNISLQKTEVISTPYGKIKAPGYYLDPHFIWGATAMIISELVEMLK